MRILCTWWGGGGARAAHIMATMGMAQRSDRIRRRLQPESHSAGQFTCICSPQLGNKLPAWTSTSTVRMRSWKENPQVAMTTSVHTRSAKYELGKLASQFLENPVNAYVDTLNCRRAPQQEILEVPPRSPVLVRCGSCIRPLSAGCIAPPPPQPPVERQEASLEVHSAFSSAG